MEFKTDLDNSCAFHIEKKPLCVEDNVLEKIVKDTGVDTIKDIDKTIEILKTKFGCLDEVCVIKKSRDIIGADEAEKIIRENFKPQGPRLTKEWLSNIEIDEVLGQFQKKYTERCFYHIPFQMIDFEDTGGELATMHWPTLYSKDHRTFGSVINTDKSTGRGIHWFSIFGDFSDDAEEFTLEYFNSSGELPKDEIIYWAKKAQSNWAQHFKKPIKLVVATRIVNQQNGYDCGPYALYYIISRLSGIPHSYFKYNKVGDDNMREFRKFLFR